MSSYVWSLCAAKCNTGCSTCLPYPIITYTKEAAEISLVTEQQQQQPLLAAEAPELVPPAKPHVHFTPQSPEEWTDVPSSPTRQTRTEQLRRFSHELQLKLQLKLQVASTAANRCSSSMAADRSGSTSSSSSSSATIFAAGGSASTSERAAAVAVPSKSPGSTTFHMFADDVYYEFSVEDKQMQMQPQEPYRSVLGAVDCPTALPVVEPTRTRAALMSGPMVRAPVSAFAVVDGKDDDDVVVNISNVRVRNPRSEVMFMQGVPTLGYRAD